MWTFEIESHTTDSTLQRRFMTSTYNEALQAARDNIGDDLIGVTYDETTNKCHRHIANFYVRSLEKNAGLYLIHLEQLDEVNAESMIVFFKENLKIFYDDGMYECICPS